MTLSLRYLAHSEVGLVRKNNQDSAYVSPTMLMVADGMGGAAAGDLASAIAIRELKAVDAPASGEEMLDVVDEAIESASNVIRELTLSDPQLDGMGSTVCGVMFDGTELGLANIGDSRAYRYRDGELTRLSRDHSWVQTLVDEGRITEAEALEHPHRSLILRVINGQAQHLPDLELLPAQAGDRLLICSDGLCGFVTDDVLAGHLEGERAEVMQDLIDLAHQQGGQDNITIVVADIVEGEPEGTPEVLGAAALLDLDNPHEATARLAVPSPSHTPRPDPQAGEIARYTPLAKRHRAAWVKPLLFVLLPLLAIGGGGWAWYSFTQQQYYLGPDGDYLAIYQGIPEPVFSLPLSHVVKEDTTRVADLPIYYQEQVRGTLPATSYADAEATLTTLREKAASCIEQRQARETPSPSPTPSNTKSSKKESKSPSAKPSASATPSPTDTPTDTATPAAPTEC